MAGMNQPEGMRMKISARDRAQRLMNQLTAGVALMAVAGIGVFGYVSAATVPGSTPSTAAASASTSTRRSTSSSSLSSSSGTVSLSSGSTVAVSGGS